jgi:L-ascorbate metabolism protein UlaG (beta-lactamase superfamily)
VPESRIVELDWNQTFSVGSVTLTCTEARHFSGRGLARNTTLWSSWAVTGPRHRAFIGGDTGYTPAFKAIAAAHEPFDLTVLPIGSYGPRWPYIHMTPEEAVRAHQDLTDGGRDLPPGLLVPVHWATFNLGLHTWSEPAQRLVVAAEKAGVPLAVPRPGERVDAITPDPPTDWWSAVSH